MAGAACSIASAAPSAASDNAEVVTDLVIAILPCNRPPAGGRAALSQGGGGGGQGATSKKRPAFGIGQATLFLERRKVEYIRKLSGGDPRHGTVAERRKFHSRQDAVGDRPAHRRQSGDAIWRQSRHGHHHRQRLRSGL